MSRVAPISRPVVGEVSTERATAPGGTGGPARPTRRAPRATPTPTTTKPRATPTRVTPASVPFARRRTRERVNRMLAPTTTRNPSVNGSSRAATGGWASAVIRSASDTATAATAASITQRKR